MSDVVDPFEGFDSSESGVGVASDGAAVSVDSLGAVVDTSDFSDFSAMDAELDEGEFGFSLDRARLRDAAGVVRLTASQSPGVPGGLVRLSIFKDKVRLASFNQYAFSECFVPVVGGVEGVVEGGVGLVFSVDVLDKIARTFPDGDIGFVFDAGKRMLTVKKGSVVLGLTTYKVSDFVDYHRNLGDPEFVSGVDPARLSEAIGYGSLFVDRSGAGCPEYSVTSVRGGRMVSGHGASIGHFGHSSLEGFDINVHNESLRVLGQVLPRLNGANVGLWRAGNFHILRDESVYVGLEVPYDDFPDTDIPSILGAVKSDRLVLSRSELLSSLSRLSVVDAGSELMVRFRVEGEGDAVVLRLETKDRSGKVSHDSFSCVRECVGESGGGVLDVSVKVGVLQRLVGHFSTVNVELEVSEAGNAVFLNDVPADGTSCVSVLTALSGEGVAG